MAPWTVPVHVVFAPLSQMTRKTHGQALVCLRWTMTSWTVLVHVVLTPLSQMTRKTHGQAPVCLRWTTASARRPTLDSICVYVHEPLSAQLPSLVMAGNAPVSNDEEEPRSGICAPRVDNSLDIPLGPTLDSVHVHQSPLRNLRVVTDGKIPLAYN